MSFKRYITGIIIASFIMVTILIASFALISHNKVVLFSTYSQIMLLIVGTTAATMVLVEAQKRNKVVFSLLALFWAQQILSIIYTFMPTLFPENKFAGHMYFQYVNGSLGLFMQSTIIAGCVVLMNTRIRTWLALSLVGMIYLIFLISELYPLATNPRYLYTTPDITDFRIIDRAWTDIHLTEGVVTVEGVARRVGLSRWEGRKRVGELTYAEALRRVKEIEPYLFGSNYNMLIYKPLNNLWWQANAVTAFIILLTIVNWFFGGSPTGVYFERISVIFLTFTIFEVFHFHTYANLTSYADYLNYFNIGAFLSLLSLAVLLFVLILRLRFLVSSEGQYYESRVTLNADSISQWRDGFDNYVVQKFFKKNPFKARFLIKNPRQ
jgi:hypothetical protein